MSVVGKSRIARIVARGGGFIHVPTKWAVAPTNSRARAARYSGRISDPDGDPYARHRPDQRACACGMLFEGANLGKLVFKVAEQ
jgi:hypothetical protein